MKHAYLAGPIDYTGDADDRSVRAKVMIRDFNLPIYLFDPHKAYDARRGSQESIAVNMAALGSADLLLVVWDAIREPSFGTPVEIWRFVSRQVNGGDDVAVIVLGDLGRGLFATRLRELGVREVDSWRQMALAIRDLTAPSGRS